MDNTEGNHHLQFTAQIWTNDENLAPSSKKDKFQIVMNKEFPFLDMKMCWSLEGDLKFGLFREIDIK